MRKILFMLMIAAILACPVTAARYRQHQVTIVDEFGDAVTNIDQIEILDVNTSTTSTIYPTRAGGTMTNPITTTSTGSTFVQSLGLVTWFQAAPTYKITVTESGASLSLTIDNQAEGDTRFPFYANYIGTAASLTVGDDNLLNIGTSADFTHDWDNANSRYIIAPASDDSGTFHIGKAAVHTDIYWHTGVAITSDYVLFDEGSANVQFIDVDLLLDSAAVLFFGDSSDMSINYDEANNDLDVLSTTALDEIAWGATGDGYDQIWHSTTAGDYMKFSYATDALLLEDMTLAIGDGELLLFGDTVGTGTMSLSVATAKLSLLQVVADTGTFDIGVAGTDVPTTWHGETSGAEVTFTGDTVIVDGIDMTINDDDILAFGDSAEITIQYDEDGDNDLQIVGDVTIEGTTPLLTMGDAGEEDTQINFDGNAQDFSLGIDDTADDFVLSMDSALGTTNIIAITDTPTDITFHDATEADAVLRFDGNAEDFMFGLDDSADDFVIGRGATFGTADSRLTILNGADTTTVVIGDAAEFDQIVAFDGNAQDFYIGIDDTDDDLNIGVGQTPGTTAAIEVTEDARVTITTAINFPLEVVAATNVITADEGGKIFVLSHATEFTSTLPTASTAAGMVVTFIIADAPESADFIVSTGNTHEDIMYGLIQESETDTTEDGPTAQAQDRCNFKDGVAVIGDYATFTCDGTNWYVRGMTAADGGITFDTQ